MQNGIDKQPRGHILIIDQNQDTLTLLETLLGWRGYQVTTAADGLEGLEKFRQGHFQLILTDLFTPGMSGWELGCVVKNSEPSVRMALVTGLDFCPEPVQCPFDAIINKPFHFEEFHCLVDSLIQSTHLNSNVG